MQDLVKESEKVIADIEKSLERISEIGTATTLYKSAVNQIDKMWLVLKGIVLTIIVMLILGGLVGGSLWYHFQLDNERFTNLSLRVNSIDTCKGNANGITNKN